MTPEQARAFAVETTAEIEVLRQSVAALLTMQLKPLSSAKQDDFLTVFEKEIGEMPASYNEMYPEVTAFYEEVAAALPHHAERMASSVRYLLSD